VRGVTAAAHAPSGFDASPASALHHAPLYSTSTRLVLPRTGYHLALELAQGQGRAVTILHEGKGPNAKEAHRAYGDLDTAGVKVIWCEDLTDAPACLAKLEGATFGSVIDNWSKSPEAITPYAAAAKDWCALSPIVLRL